MFRSLLIPTDLSPSSARVLRRTTLLPIAAGADITLLHVVPDALPSVSRRRAEADARSALKESARDLSSRLSIGKVNQLVKSGGAAAVIGEEGARLGADLIVMGRGGGRALRDLFLGSTAERVLRRAHRPVLVVRLRPREPYRRPLLALDVDRAAAKVLGATLQILPVPRPRLGLVHAYDIPYYGLIYPSLTLDRQSELRQSYRDQVSGKITQLIDAASPDELKWKSYIRRGSPRYVIPKIATRTRADLLVLGTHGYRGVAHVFLGTVAGDVLRDVQCDVLVVPPEGLE
jgi:nucleotide-binding universal stress UspA family protein